MQLYHCHKSNKRSRCNLKEVPSYWNQCVSLFSLHSSLFFLGPISSLFTIGNALFINHYPHIYVLRIVFFVFPLNLCTYCISPRHLCVLSCGAVPRFDPPLVSIPFLIHFDFSTKDSRESLLSFRSIS